MAYVKIYTGSEVLAKAVAAKLEEANIPYIEKDVSAGGAVIGNLDGGVFEVHVEEADKATAKELLAGFVN
jgi:hypothetical protein